MLNFTWQTTKITDLAITVQVRFMNAEYISSEFSQPDNLKITMLQSKLKDYVSQKGQAIVDLP
jgi:hypothetical protein